MRTLWSAITAADESVRVPLTKIYFFAGGFAGALAAGDFAGALAGVLTGGVFAAGAFATGAASFAFDEAAVFALASAGAAVLAFASAVLAFEFDESVVASGLPDKTETLPVKAGIARKRADNMNVVAAMIVTLDKTVAVPRGANAELETLLVNNAPASVLPGCNRTAAISVRHERKNIPYKM